MTTARDARALRETLKNDGKMEFFYAPPPRAQYYRPDGSPLPSLLPSDAHGMKYYFAKGFTLTPARDAVPSTTPAYPDTVVPYTPGGTKLEQVEAITVLKQEKRQGLREDAAGGFVTEGLVIPNGTNPEESQAIYDRWIARRLVEEAPLPPPVELAAGHHHKFKSPHKGSRCITDGCNAKRQRRS